MKTPQEDYENKLQILKAPERKEFDKKNFFAEGDKMSRLEKYEHLDDKDVHNKPFIPPQGFKGPVAERIATDKQFVPLFIIIYVGLIIYAYFTMTQGVPDRLINGMDFRGELCGIKGLTTKHYLYYAGPVDDIQVAWCVHQCPPSSGRQTCMYDTDHLTITTFCYIQMQADKMSRYCIPKEPKSRTLVMEQLDSFRSVIRRIASDLWITWDITLSSFAFCILLSYLFTVLAKYENVIMPLIWGGIIGSVASFGIVAWMCWLEQLRIYNFRCIPGTDPNACGGWPVTFFQVLTFIIAGIGAFYLLFIILMIRRIKRGIELIRHAQRIVKVLGQIRMFPFMIAFVGLVVCSLAFILIVNAMTVGEIQLSRAKNIDGHLLYKIFYNDIIQYCIVFVLFVVVFTLTLILVMNDMFTSYALSIWYFTKLKSTVHIPFLFSMKTLFRYHFGTCIFITCNLLFLTIPQSIMLYVRQLLRWLPQDSNVVRYCQACFMWCIHGFEIFLRYISKHSVVQVAIWSEPYYQSAKKAYFLIFRNRNKIKDLDTLQETIVFQLRLCTAMIACLPVYIYVSFAESTFMGLSTSDVETPIIPTFYVLFCGLFFTSVFQGSYDITCKTIIQLYLMDTEMFFGEQRFVEPFIKEFMEYVGKLEDDEWQVGFIRPIVFDKEKFNKKAKKIQEYNEKVKQGDADDIDAQSEEEDDNQEKIEDYEVDYEDDKEPNYNPTIGLPTVRPSDSQFKRVDSDDLAGNLSQTMMQDLKPQGVFKQGPILNTSQQSFMIQVGNDKSMVSQISEVSEKPQQQQKIIKKQRI